MSDLTKKEVKVLITLVKLRIVNFEIDEEIIKKYTKLIDKLKAMKRVLK